MNISVDGNAAGLRSRSIAALGWSAIDVAGRQGIQFVVMLILARLLSPAEFGLLGMLSLFIALGSSFVDSGFGLALIQRKEITQADKSSVFLFNAAMGALMASGIFAAAPLIAAFYKEPILVPLTRLMALNLFVGSFGTVQASLLNRELDFLTPCKAGIVAGIVSGTVSVWMAMKGCGVWSLAVQTLSATTISTTVIWMLHPWRPTLKLRVASLRSLFKFGSRMLACGLMGAFFDRIQLTVIGKAFSAVELGYYVRAYSTQQMPVSFLSVIVARVAFPVFSRISEDPKALRRGVQQVLISLMIPTLPMMVGLAVVARPVVLVLFGDKWLPCVPYLQILSLMGVFWPWAVINLNVLTATGRSDLFLRLDVTKRILLGLGLLISYRMSVTAMAWALLIVCAVGVFINTYYSKTLIGYGPLNQLRDIAPYGAISGMMGVVAWAAGELFSNSPVLQLSVAVTSGAAFYCATCYIFRLQGYRSAVASGLGALSSIIGRGASEVVTASNS